MSDPMEDEEFVYAAIDAMRFAARKVRPATVSGMTIDAQWRNECCREIAMLTAVLRALNEAGYRIAKPDASHSVEYALYCDEDGEGDDICQVAGSYGPPDMAAAEILNAARNYAPEEIEIEEVIRVPVTPDELRKLLDWGN